MSRESLPGEAGIVMIRAAGGDEDVVDGMGYKS